MQLKRGSTTRVCPWLLPSRDCSSNPLKPSLNPAMTNPPAERAALLGGEQKTHNQPKENYLMNMHRALRFGFLAVLVTMIASTLVLGATTAASVSAAICDWEGKIDTGKMIRRPPRSTLFPHESSDLGGRRII